VKPSFESRTTKQLAKQCLPANQWANIGDAPLAILFIRQRYQRRYRMNLEHSMPPKSTAGEQHANTVVMTTPLGMQSAMLRLNVFKTAGILTALH
jgi:hypothetical protein